MARTSGWSVRATLLVCATFISLDALQGQEPGPLPPLDSRVQLRSYVFSETGVEVPFGLFVPTGYTADSRWPLIVALHGAGGTHQAMLRYEGTVDYAEQFGYIVATPLGYHVRGYYGALGPGIAVESFTGANQSMDGLPSNLGELSERDVMNVLDMVRQEFNVDPDRVYLYGYSMGGVGTYHLAGKYPALWSAIAVAAPGSAPLRDWTDTIQRFRRIPSLLLHGDQDPTIPVGESRRAAETMRALGMQFLYVEIPGANHVTVVRSRESALKVFSFFNVVRTSQRPTVN